MRVRPSMGSARPPEPGTSGTRSLAVVHCRNLTGLGTSPDARNLEPRNLLWRAVGGPAGAEPGTLEPRPGRLGVEPGTSYKIQNAPPALRFHPPGPLAPPTAEPGTWMEPGTWNLEPGTYRPKNRKKIAPAAQAEPGTSEPGTSTYSRGTLAPRNRDLGTGQGVEVTGSRNRN